jgi:hypothetical protein
MSILTVLPLEPDLSLTQKESQNILMRKNSEAIRRRQINMARGNQCLQSNGHG